VAVRVSGDAKFVGTAEFDVLKLLLMAFQYPVAGSTNSHTGLGA
jgi:hypothetical protein